MWKASRLHEGVWRCRYLCKNTNVRVVRLLVLSVLLYSCETWTLTGKLRQRLLYFVTMPFRRILGHRWHDSMSSDLVLNQAGLRQGTLHSLYAPTTPLWVCGETGGDLWERFGHAVPSVCLGDSQTEAKGEPSKVDAVKLCSGI